MELSDIKKLSSILHENGDKILDGSSKLSISINLLQYLNESFNLIIDQKDVVGSTFQVINSSNSRLEIFRDLQFLHDFIQKTIGLKIGVGTINEVFEGTADISKFRSLKLLEIRKVPVQFISGIKYLRPQIHFLICVKCLNTLEELLIQCGADKSSTQLVTWNELREASFSHNNLKVIDNSIKYVPFLQMLDLSHNRLTDAQPLDCLHNLKYLNLSYNLLERLPIFNQEQSRKLLSLIIKNNYIEELTGLVSLTSLRELDVSNNCLIDHSTLCIIPMLANLQELSLEGNPLSYHPHHRKLTCRFLHSNTASVKFLLDHLLLSNSEKVQIGTYHTNSVRLASYIQERHATSLSSSINESQSSNLPSTPVAPELARLRTRKTGRVREPIISDQNSTTNNDLSSEQNLSKSAMSKSGSSLETSVEHLETKKQIEGLREKYGEFWLHSKGGSLLVQDVLGMERTPIPVITSSPYLEVKRELEKDNESSLSNSPNSLRTLIPENESVLTDNTVYVTARESEITSENDTMNEIFKSYETNEETEEEEKGNKEETQDEEEDVNSRIYLAQIQRDSNNYDELLLCVNLDNKIIRERDATTGKIREQWPLSMLESCEKTAKGVYLKFDTVKRSKQARDYTILDSEDIQNLVDILRNVLDSRSLTEMNQTVYRCLRCSTQFTQERKDKTIILSKEGNGSASLKCPSCQSTIVMEEEEIKPAKPLITTRDLTPERAEIALPHSPSPSSIAYDNQTTGASPRLLKVTADVHTPAAFPQVNTSLLQPHCSATSLNESTCSKSDSVTKRGDSDIEVLSDPSQDSIEVLAVLARGSSVTPKRRRSSEERRVEITPSAVINSNVEQKPLSETTTTTASTNNTNNTTTTTTVGLTESSSSDSLTDSVCTAYENKTSKSAQLAVTDTIKIPEKHILHENTELEITVDEPKTAETVGIFSSMLDGALISKFYSELIAMSSPSKTANPVSTGSPKTTNDTVEFSYTDFTQVDHRVKLFLYLNIFEDEVEELVWLLRAEILSNTSEQVFSGCVVLSTRKVYILKIEGDIVGDEPQQWLHKYEGYTVDRLQTIFTLPWKQGIGLEIRQSSLVGTESSFYILCFLQDIIRTSNFLYHLGKGTLPDTCELNTKMSERTNLNIQQLMLSNSSQPDSDLTVCLLHVFSACEVQSNDEIKKLNMSVLLITNCDLILTEDNLTWLQPESPRTPAIYTTQQINNLVEVECDEFVLTLNFLVENEGKAETWSITTATKNSVDAIIAAIRDPWEKLFSVTLQVNTKTANTT